jgi:hypothetical protein
MRMNHFSQFAHYIFVIVVSLFLIVPHTRVRSATVTVLNTNDSGNDSLRLAISIANANPGTTIAFNIPTSDPGFSSGVFTIKPLSPLPTITGNGTIIDGTTQTAFTGDTNVLGPEVVLNGLLTGDSNGLFIRAGNCVVRGLVINGFGVEQVVIQGTGAKGNVVRGCYINTDPTGSFSAANPIAFPGGTDGIEINGGAQDNTIGGTGSGEGNVISGNLSNGVFISDAATSGNLIQGNLIGMNATGTGALPNGACGVVYQAGTHDNVIGGTVQGSGNIIAFNGNVGILMDNNFGGDTINNLVRFNSIFSNQKLGISLGPVIVPGTTSFPPNPNDHCDLDTGPNNLQNYPVLSSGVVTGNTIAIAGTLDSAPNQTFTIDLFASPDCSASGFGEGKTYLGSTTASTDNTCSGAFSVSLPYQPSDGNVITATATDSANNTSEFSRCLALDTPPVARCHSVTVSPGPNCTANASIDNGSFDPDPGDTITLSQSPAGPYSLGPTTVTLTVTDNHGLSSRCQATVTVVDTTPPTIICPPNKTVSTDPNQCSAVVTYAAPTVTDNCPCSGAGSAKMSAVQTSCAPVCNPPSGATFPKGTTTVACSVSDASGNQNSCSFSVTVNDTQPPVFPNGCSAPVSVAAVSACPIGTSTVVSYLTPEVTDNCPGVRVTCSPPSGSTFPLGTTNVTCTTTDTSGGAAQCSFTVTVFSLCLQDETNAGNFVLVNAMTGDYVFFCNGSPLASGQGTLTTRACIGSIDHTKGDRRVHIQWDTTAAGGRGSGTAIVQVGPNKTVCQITDKNMSNNTCSAQTQAPKGKVGEPQSKN